MGNAKSLKSNSAHKDALRCFIESPGQDDDVNALWKAFDQDNSGYIDQDELQEIVFHLIVIFWEYSTPKKSVPKRDQLQSVIDHICTNIMIEVDLDKNGQITRNEFDLFGTYVVKQWEACEKKVTKKGRTGSTTSIKFNFSQTFRGNRSASKH